MYTAIRGIYENGVLKFTETPPSIEKSEVVVLFMEEEKREQSAGNVQKSGVILGSLAGQGYRIPDDFNNSLEDLNDYM